MEKRSLTSFSLSPPLSPPYLLVRMLLQTVKNVVPHSVATALARRVLPVPGGPTMRTPHHGVLIHLKKSGIYIGRTTASSSNLLASVKSAMSSQQTLGYFWTMTCSSISETSWSSPGLTFSSLVLVSSMVPPLSSSPSPLLCLCVLHHHSGRKGLAPGLLVYGGHHLLLLDRRIGLAFLGEE